jgi:hypothetical protein
MLQLDVVRARLLGVSALLTLVCPVVLGEIMLEPLEPGAPPPATGLEPPLPHWLYAVRQAALTPEQVGWPGRARVAGQCAWGQRLACDTEGGPSPPAALPGLLMALLCAQAAILAGTCVNVQPHPTPPHPTPPHPTPPHPTPPHPTPPHPRRTWR